MRSTSRQPAPVRLRRRRRSRVAVALLFGLLGIAACQSGDGGSTESAPVVAKAGARTSAFRDIGKRSASDLTLR